MAGLEAAYSASSYDNEVKVTLLTATSVHNGGCSYQAHGVNVVLNQCDSVKLHIQDTLKGGGYINDRVLVDVLCHEVIDRIRDLENLGLVFDKDGNNYDTGTYGGSDHGSALHISDITGLKIIKILVEQAIKNGIHIKENRVVIHLLHENNACYGVVAYNEDTAKLEIWYAKSVVLASGGGACVYPITSVNSDKLAFGIVMAFEMGLELYDMEMVQFHPTGVLLPQHKLNGILLEEEMRTSGGKLFNQHHERYMFIYDERGESATSDIVARSSYLEILAGKGTANGGVILDISNFDVAYIKARFPNTVHRLRELGVDLLTTKILEVSPTAHFLMGGIKIDENTACAYDNLWVCGEDAGGIHGANCLGGNGIADALVFGWRAGLNATENAKNSILHTQPVEFKIPILNVDCDLYHHYDTHIKNIMWQKVGVVRNGHDLQLALNQLHQLQDECSQYLLYISYDEYGLDAIDNLLLGRELYQKLQLALIITTAAMSRTNSLGSHYRVDASKKDVLFNTVVVKKHKSTVVYHNILNT